MIAIQQIEKHIEDIKEQQKNSPTNSGNYFHYDWKISILQKELDTIHGKISQVDNEFNLTGGKSPTLTK